MKKYIMALFLSICLLTYNSISCFCSPIEDTIQSNEIPNWPAGPEIGAKAAILIEANTGVILYAKNIHEHMYPASTTKMITALLAAENSSMDEMVKFSYDAVFSLEPGSSNIGIDPGQAMNMEECLYGLMVASANEVANAIAEHVGGNMDSFVEMMNKKVESLGLKDTHFTNANGLFNQEHYTSAYDLAIIAQEFFNNEYLAKIGNTASYHFKATSTQPDDFYVRNKHKLISGEVPYVGIKGGKTGYTSEAGETLVTCAEQDGLNLICVVLNEESPEQFYDTVKLFDYGYSNFDRINVSENENRYSITSNYFFPTTVDVIGNSKQILELDKNNFVIKPKNINFDQMETELVYNERQDKEMAYINYSYHGAYLGFGKLIAVENNPELSAFGIENVIEQQTEEQSDVIEDKPVFINILVIIQFIIFISLILCVFTFIHAVIVNYNLLDNYKRKRGMRPKRRREKNKLKF